MNYFELYPGDYLRDTTRLSLTEHGAYLRLLMAYYAEEAPLPSDYDELFVVTSAVRAIDKEAVRKIGDRFFPIGDDGLRHNGRADAEIEKAQRRIETARVNGAKRHRNNTQRDTQRDTQRLTHSGEALHTPHATISVGETEASTQDLATQTAAGRACLAMRQAGCAQTNPSHPDLLAALGAGITPEALADTVREGLSRAHPITRPFLWAIATARSRHAAGPSTIPEHAHANGSSRRKLSAVEQVEQAIRERREREAAAAQSAAEPYAAH